MPPTPGIFLLSSFFVGLLILVSCAGEEQAPPPQPEIVLISLDTVRRDALGPYLPGDANSPTPHLDAFAEKAVVFERAYAAVPFTLPSHLSMLTGVYPDVHGVDTKKEVLNPSIPTLVQILRREGYRAQGLVSNLWMKPGFGLERGFDHYERVAYGLTYAERINARIFELLDASPAESEASDVPVPDAPAPDAPNFLFLHYIDAHSDFLAVGKNTLPYYAPPEFLAEIGISEGDESFCDAEGRCATQYLLAADTEGREITPEQMEQIRQLYDAGLRALDRELGVLFEGLKARGLWEDALIIITSDHGEEFREHGEFIHTQPYTENLGVPLIVKMPQGEFGGSRRNALVETLDLPATILELLELPIPEHMQGESFLPALRGERTKRRYTLGRDKKNHRRFALRTDEFTLVEDLESGAVELFDLRSDPEELTDVSSTFPEKVAALQEILRRAVEENELRAEDLAAERLSEDSLLSPEEQEKLKSIGYLQ